MFVDHLIALLNIEYLCTEKSKGWCVINVISLLGPFLFDELYEICNNFDSFQTNK